MTGKSVARAVLEGLVAVTAAVGKVFLLLVVGGVVIALRGAFGGDGR